MDTKRIQKILQEILKKGGIKPTRRDAKKTFIRFTEKKMSGRKPFKI